MRLTDFGRGAWGTVKYAKGSVLVPESDSRPSKPLAIKCRVRAVLGRTRVRKGAVRTYQQTHCSEAAAGILSVGDTSIAMEVYSLSSLGVQVAAKDVGMARGNAEE